MSQRWPGIVFGWSFFPQSFPAVCCITPGDSTHHTHSCMTDLTFHSIQIRSAIFLVVRTLLQINSTGENCSEPIDRKEIPFKTIHSNHTFVLLSISMSLPFKIIKSCHTFDRIYGNPFLNVKFAQAKEGRDGKEEHNWIEFRCYASRQPSMKSNRPAEGHSSRFTCWVGWLHPKQPIFIPRIQQTRLPQLKLCWEFLGKSSRSQIDLIWFTSQSDNRNHNLLII